MTYLSFLCVSWRLGDFAVEYLLKIINKSDRMIFSTGDNKFKVAHKSKILVISCLVFLFSLQVLSAQVGDKITLAVMDFKNNTTVIRYDRLQRSIADMLKTELSRYQEITVLEREKIENILAEYALAQAGVIENKHAMEVGRLAGAEYIITGEINKTSGLLRLDVHLIKVVTGQILGEKVSGESEKNLEQMVKLLADNLIFDLTGLGERKVSKKLSRFYPEWSMVATGALAITTVVFHSQYKQNYDKYHDVTQLGEFDKYYNRANKNYKNRNIMLWVTGAAAITSFVLWQVDRSKGNKIYAHHNQPPAHAKKYALGLLADGTTYGFLINVHF